MSITYLSPATPRPVGGIKLLYRHAELLVQLGFASDVCHPQDPGFACCGFEHRASVRHDQRFDPREDFIVIPEIWASPFAAACLAQGVRYALFVQNGYLMHRGADGGSAEALSRAYAGASLVLAISDDSARLVRLAWPALPQERLLRVAPVLGEAFRAGAKRRLIAYMPRKLPHHAAALAFLLRHDLSATGWALQSLDGLPEHAVAAALAESAIFLSFGELEGIGLPPLEAAVSGNLVVGYSGQGGREYFQRPLLREVAHGDLPAFVEAVRAAMLDVEQGLLESAAVQQQVSRLREACSPAAVATGLRAFAHRVRALRG